MSDIRFGSRYVEGRPAWYDGPHAGVYVFDLERNEEVLFQFPRSHGNGDRSRENVARFEAQAELFARLNHPCIVPLLDRGEMANGTLFYTQPAVLTLSLSFLLKGDLPRRHPLENSKATRLTFRERVRLLIDVSDALRTVHEAGLLHLSLTPSSIQLSATSQVFVRGGEPYNPPVFMPRHWALDGPSYYYGAPEQIEIHRRTGREDRCYRADAFDARADVHALGGILHFLIHDVGDEHRSSGPTKYPTIQTRIAETWPLGETALEDVTLANELEPIWRRALQPEPANRWPTASAFARELRQALWSAN
jgi:serine/threonine-protein kinase